MAKASINNIWCLQGMFMALDFRSDPAAELSHFAGRNGLGVDGIFVDCPTTAVAWRQLEYGSVNATVPEADQQQSHSTCTSDQWSTGLVAFVSVLIGWAGARYLLVCIGTVRQFVFPRYQRLSDESSLRVSEMTDRS